MNKEKGVNNILVVTVLVMTFAIFGAWTVKSSEKVEKINDIPTWNSWNESIEPRPPVEKPNQEKNKKIPTSYADALKIAEAENQNIFLFFGEDWCHWCKEMKEKTLSHPDVKNALNFYVVYHVDPNKDQNLYSKYKVTGIPAYFVIDKKESVHKTKKGFVTHVQFLDWLK